MRPWHLYDPVSPLYKNKKIIHRQFSRHNLGPFHDQIQPSVEDFSD